ncbi:MAG: sigma-54 dependent transcriptional regulator [Pseudomonadota bacterium]
MEQELPEAGEGARRGRILLIEESRKTSHDTVVVLQFLGEEVVASDRNGWREAIEDEQLDPSRLKLVLVGEYRPRTLERLLSEVDEWYEGVPLVLIGRHDALEELSGRMRNRVTATVPLPLSYQPVLDALHKAKVYREYYERLRDIGSVRDYNMFRSLVGRSDAIHRIRQVMGHVADTEVTVLITGESGTGKEVVARNLHANSPRAGKPFVPINCGAIPPDLLESELFGHEKGAFTGAITARVGRFELAEGGTLFLDEIGDMPLPMQVKLLRVLQEQTFERVGGTETRHCDVRILAATHRNLEKMIEEGTFRQDLFYRLNVFPMEMPALRERNEDIPFLLNELISRLENTGRGSVRFNSAAIRSLRQHPWPGNVRELANLVERMAILHPHEVVGVSDLPSNMRYEDEDGVGALEDDSEEMLRLGAESAPPVNGARPRVTGNGGRPTHLLPMRGLDLKEYLGNLEKDLIEQALEDSNGVVARAAERLHVRRTTLVEKMRKYGVER